MSLRPACALVCFRDPPHRILARLDTITYSYADILTTLLRLLDWLTASVLVIGGIIAALITNALIVHTLRTHSACVSPKPDRC